MNTRRIVLIALLSSVTSSLFAADAPFGIDKRPAPAGANLEALLPAKVGDFTRDALPKDAKLASDADLNVTYRSGKDSVDVGLSKPDSVADVRDAIEVSRDEAVRSKVPMAGAKTSLKSEPAYFHAHDFIAWSRGTYFFYAKASTPDALARFMATFPY